jgi:hypothetical protein
VRQAATARLVIVVLMVLAVVVAAEVVLKLHLLPAVY